MVSRDHGILIVDDDPQILELYTTFLEGIGDIRTAEDAASAVAQLDVSPDVVLLDRRMPGASGEVVLAEIERRGVECGVVMVTAIVPSDNIVDLPFHAYLTKPVTREELRECVARALRLSRRDIQMQRYISLLARRQAVVRGDAEDERSREQALGELDRRLSEVEARIEPPLGDLDRELVTRLTTGAEDDTGFEVERRLNALFG